MPSEYSSEKKYGIHHEGFTCHLHSFVPSLRKGTGWPVVVQLLTEAVCTNYVLCRWLKLDANWILIIFLWGKLIVKMKWKTMMKQLCYIAEKQSCVGFYTVLECSHNWLSGPLCRFLPDLVWNHRQPNFLQRSFPALVLLDKKDPLSAASLVMLVSVKHFSCHNYFCKASLLSMY